MLLDATASSLREDDSLSIMGIFLHNILYIIISLVRKNPTHSLILRGILCLISDIKIPLVLY